MMDRDADEQTENWLVAAMQCVICGYEWVAVYPDVAPGLECAECGYMNPVPEDEDNG